jgi:hypothetical protein
MGGRSGVTKDLDISEAWLRERYVVEKKTMVEIGQLKGCSDVNIRYYLCKYNIPIMDRRRYNDGMSWVERRNIFRVACKQRCIDYLGGQCAWCGYHKCNKALEFHHKNPTYKEQQISLFIAYCSGRRTVKETWELLSPELDKCTLLCANCHREEHERLDSQRMGGK